MNILSDRSYYWFVQSLSKPVLYNSVIRLFIARGHFLTVYIWTSKSSRAEADDVPRPPPWSFLTFHRSQHLLREALQRQVILFLIWAAFDWWNGNMTLWTKWSIVEYWELHQTEKSRHLYCAIGEAIGCRFNFPDFLFQVSCKGAHALAGRVI